MGRLAATHVGEIYIMERTMEHLSPVEEKQIER